jgi:hypothetical protein
LSAIGRFFVVLLQVQKELDLAAEGGAAHDADERRRVRQLAVVLLQVREELDLGTIL